MGMLCTPVLGIRICVSLMWWFDVMGCDVPVSYWELALGVYALLQSHTGHTGHTDGE